MTPKLTEFEGTDKFLQRNLSQLCCVITAQAETCNESFVEITSQGDGPETHSPMAMPSPRAAQIQWRTNQRRPNFVIRPLTVQY
jgi:hypothetical protein